MMLQKQIFDPVFLLTLLKALLRELENTACFLYASFSSLPQVCLTSTS